MTSETSSQMIDPSQDQPVDLDFLTPEERDVILEVLARDENLKRKEEERIELLKKKIRELRAEEFSRISFDVARLCGRCLQEFHWLFNRGQICSKCRLRVCKKCRQMLHGKKAWMCLVCIRILELESQTGKWFYSDYPQNRKNMSSCQIISALDLLRSSLNQSTESKNDGEQEEKDDEAGKSTGKSLIEAAPEPKLPIILQLTGKEYLAKDDDEMYTSTTDLSYHRDLMMDMISSRDESLKKNGGQSSGIDGNMTSDDSNQDDEDRFDQRRNLPPLKRKKMTNLASSLSSSMESLRSIYSGAGEVHYGKVLVSGEVEFSCHYDEKEERLNVNVVRCRDLGIVNFAKRSSNPYIKCYLLPEKNRKTKRKSQVVKNNLNPVFNVTFQYKISHTSLPSHSLCLMAWHSDKLGRNDFLGEVVVSLDQTSLCRLETNQWFPLRPRSSIRPSSLSYHGDFDVSIKFLSEGSLQRRELSSSNKGELHVLIRQARNLTTDKSSRLNGSFCRALLLHEKLKSTRQKSAAVQAKGNNPRWNHTFVFADVTRSSLLESSLELTFWDRERGSNDFLGGVRLNTGTGIASGKRVEFMDAKGEEAFIWQSVLDRPDIWVEGTLMLRANMTSRK